jgi:hypothetical protein
VFSINFASGKRATPNDREPVTTKNDKEKGLTNW